MAKEEHLMADNSGNVVRVCSTSEVGHPRCAVYNMTGVFYTADDEWPHGAASLADGMLDGDVIECCMHMGSFHVPTGAVKAPPCSIALRTYKVVLQDGDVYADLDRDAAGEPA